MLPGSWLVNWGPWRSKVDKNISFKSSTVKQDTGGPGPFEVHQAKQCPRNMEWIDIASVSPWKFVFAKPLVKDVWVQNMATNPNIQAWKGAWSFFKKNSPVPFGNGKNRSLGQKRSCTFPWAKSVLAETEKWGFQRQLYIIVLVCHSSCTNPNKFQNMHRLLPGTAKYILPVRVENGFWCPLSQSGCTKKKKKPANQWRKKSHNAKMVEPHSGIEPPGSWHPGHPPCLPDPWTSLASFPLLCENRVGDRLGLAWSQQVAFLEGSEAGKRRSGERV